MIGGPVGIILIFFAALLGTSMAMSIAIWARKMRGRR